MKFLTTRISYAIMLKANMKREGVSFQRSETPGKDGQTNVGEIKWVYRLGPTGGWEVDWFYLNRYSPAREYRVEAFGDKNGVDEWHRRQQTRRTAPKSA